MSGNRRYDISPGRYRPSRAGDSSERRWQDIGESRTHLNTLLILLIIALLALWNRWHCVRTQTGGLQGLQVSELSAFSLAQQLRYPMTFAVIADIRLFLDIQHRFGAVIS